jgi:hypothetical protein
MDSSERGHYPKEVAMPNKRQCYMREFELEAVRLLQIPTKQDSPWLPTLKYHA